MTANISGNQKTQIVQWLQSEGLNPATVTAEQIREKRISAPSTIQNLPAREAVQLIQSDPDISSGNHRAGQNGVAAAMSTGEAGFFSTDVPPLMESLPEKESYSTEEFLKVAQEYQGYLEDSLSEIDRLKEEHNHKVGKLVVRLETARDDFVAALIPELDAQTLQTAAEVTGYLGFGRRDPAAEIQAERTKLQDRKEVIEGDSAFNRALGTSIDEDRAELQRLKKAYAPTAELLQAVEDDPDVQALMQTKFGTDDYSWGKFSIGKALGTKESKLAKQVMQREAFEAYDDFSALRAAIDEANKTKDRKLPGIEMREEKISLQAEHASIEDRLANLEDGYLGEARDAIVQFLEDADLKEIGKNIKDNPDTAKLGQGFANYAGLTQQLEALDAFAKAKLEKTGLAMQQDLTRLQAEMTSAARRGTNINRATMDQRFNQRANTYHTGMRDYNGGYDRMYTVETYDPGMSFFEMYFWMDILSDGQLDFNMTPEHLEHASFDQAMGGAVDTMDQAAVESVGADINPMDAAEAEDGHFDTGLEDDVGTVEELDHMQEEIEVEEQQAYEEEQAALQEEQEYGGGDDDFGGDDFGGDDFGGDDFGGDDFGGDDF